MYGQLTKIPTPLFISPHIIKLEASIFFTLFRLEIGDCLTQCLDFDFDLNELGASRNVFLDGLHVVFHDFKILQLDVLEVLKEFTCQVKIYKLFQF